jgi:site-specific DNA recombinase
VSSHAARHSPALPASRLGARTDPYLIGALRKAHAMLDRDRGRPIITEAPAAQHDRKVLRLALLAPDFQQAILVGRQPASLHLERLRRMDLPLDWAEQRQMLGFAARG